MAKTWNWMPSVASSNPTLPPDAFACWWHGGVLCCDLGCCSRTVVVIEAAVNPRLMFEGCLIVFSLLLSLGLIT